MARPREFDLDQAVDEAMRLFWSQGYQRTTMRDLERAMSIGRASVYAAFPDKQVLFLRALERYRERYTLPCLEILDRDGSPLAALEGFLDCLAARYAGTATPAGCLVVLNAGHVADDAPEARAALAASVAHGEGRIAARLHEAVARGELLPNAPVPELAAFLASTTQGMASMARLGRPVETITTIGRRAMAALPRTQQRAAM